MKSLFLIHSTSSLVMMILLLLSITDSNVSSSPSGDSLGALKNESFELALGTTIKPSSNSTEESPYFLAKLKTIIGFASSMKGVYEYFNSLFNPAVTPKHTVDDVMKKIDVQFTQVKLDLAEIKEKLSAQEIYAYREVELAINGAFNDMYHKNSIDIQSRAIKLYDQLDVFLKGMLGNTNTLPDLLNTVRDLYDCGSKSMEKKMNEFIAMVHIGAGGLSFYNTAINNKAIFNGDERVEKLKSNYESIRKRVQDAMTGCASMEKAVIEKYINKILIVNQEAHVETIDVSKLLYKRFADIYPVETVWVFYTAWNYDAVVGDRPAGRHGQSYNIIFNGDGISGMTKNGGWTVIWVGHKQPAPAKWLDVRDPHSLVESQKDNHNDKIAGSSYNRNAYNIQRNTIVMPNFFSGRKPVFNLVLTNPPRKATVGTPLVGERMNIWQRRIDDIKWYFRYVYFPWTIFQEAVIVDFIIF